MRLACLGSGCASTHRIHHTRPYAHHHQLLSHICNLQSNLQNPLQCSKTISISFCNWSSVSYFKEKSVPMDQLLCVRTGASCTKVTSCKRHTMQNLMHAKNFVAIMSCLQEHIPHGACSCTAAKPCEGGPACLNPKHTP